MAKKHNTQKYTTGRSQNRENEKDSSTHKNIVYEFLKIDDTVFTIDSIYSKNNWEERAYKDIYVSINGNGEIILCRIDESIELDCDFMDKVKEIHKLSLEKVIITDKIEDIDYSHKIITKINPSTYDATSSLTVEIEGINGFYFEVGEFDIYKQWGEHDVISGHSSTLYEKANSSINLEAISKMNGFEFYDYFLRLDRD